MSINLSVGFSRAVDSAPNISKIKMLYQSLHPIAGQTDSRVHRLLKRKENSSRGRHRRLQLQLCCHTLSTSRFRNINLIPFREINSSEKESLLNGISLSLRIDSPMSNCCSHGTFLHFSLQSSHLNSCYYHQDLH